MERKRVVDVQEGGYWSNGVGDDSTFVCKEGVDGSSFFTLTLLFLFNPFPASQYSQFHQTIPCTSASVLLCLCTHLNSPFNCTSFSLLFLSSSSSLPLPSSSFSSCGQWVLHDLSLGDQTNMCSAVPDGHMNHCPLYLGVWRSGIWCQGWPSYLQDVDCGGC